jgi:hypothetical protein
LNVELTHQLAIVTERAKTALQMGAVEHQIVLCASTRNAPRR